MSLNKVDKDIMILNKAANVNSNVRKLTDILNALVTAIKQGIDPNYTTYVNEVVTEAVEAEHLITQNAISQQNKEIDDFKEAVTDQVNSYKPVVIEGDVTNAPDEEDITSENNLLKFKNRSALNGMGYVILRRGSSFASQVTLPNTIYEIRYNFDLNGASVTIPTGCTLKFEGGKLTNGKILIESGFTFEGNNSEHLNISFSYTTDISNVTIRNAKFTGSKVTDSSASTSDLNVFFSRPSTYKVTDMLIIEGCVITNYNTGIKVLGNNITISNNLLYANGSTSISETAFKSQCDIVISGQYSTEVTHSNITIINNKCLSSDVDRNIDGGENYWINNISIQGNTCVSCLDDGITENTSPYKRDCILLGYAGASDTEKYAVISNNICKNSRWGGIYVRANQTEAATETTHSKYVILIANNVVENIRRHTEDSASHIIAGIATEIAEGSLITGNSVSYITDDAGISSPCGINVGFTHRYGHAVVSNNFVKGAVAGIKNDSIAKKIDFINNRVVDCNTGIIINEKQQSSILEPEKDTFAITKGNVVSNCVIGIVNSNTYSYNVVIEDNIIIGTGETGSIGVRNDSSRGSDYPVSINRNVISSVERGIKLRVLLSLREDNLHIDYNTFKNCAIAIRCSGVNDEGFTSTRLLVVVGNIYDDCTEIFSEATTLRSIFDGQRNANGTYVIYDAVASDTPSVQPIYTQKKLFKKGDVVIPQNSSLCEYAECSEDYSEASNLYADKWKVERGTFTTTQSASYQIEGQIIYNKTLKRVMCFNGTNWVDDRGFKSLIAVGATSSRPALDTSDKGYQYFDTDLGKPIYWQGTKWVDANGADILS